MLRAEVLTASDFGERTLRFAPDPNFLEHLDRIGHMPLPPYIHREDSREDRQRYQTVYAREAGSAAAPTAGLHFTPEVLEALRSKGVQIETLTLHVGLGTFQPVRVERLNDIRLHTEHYTLPEATASAIRNAMSEGRRIIAAGTTTTRTLEHCAAVAERIEASLRINEHLSSAWPPVPRRIRLADEFSSAAIDAADACERVDGQGSRTRSVRACRPGAVPLLFLRGLHADPVGRLRVPSKYHVCFK